MPDSSQSVNEVVNLNGNSTNDAFDNLFEYGDPKGITETLNASDTNGDSLTINIHNPSGGDIQEASQAFGQAIDSYNATIYVRQNVNEMASAVRRVSSYAASSILNQGNYGSIHSHGRELVFCDGGHKFTSGRYITTDDAALAYLDKLNGYAQTEGVEYAFAIQEGWFSAQYTNTQPLTVGAADYSFPIVDSTTQWFASTEATAHVHPYAQGQFDSEIFSPTDIANANSNGYISYLATPSGNILKYDPGSGTVYIFDRQYSVFTNSGWTWYPNNGRGYYAPPTGIPKTLPPPARVLNPGTQ